MAPTPAPAAANLAAERPVAVDVVEARDAAVRTRLKQGPATFEELLVAVPVEVPPLYPDEKRVALGRALSRLKLKTREVRKSGDTWILVTA